MVVSPDPCGVPTCQFACSMLWCRRTDGAYQVADQYLRGSALFPICRRRTACSNGAVSPLQCISPLVRSKQHEGKHEQDRAPTHPPSMTRPGARKPIANPAEMTPPLARRMSSSRRGRRTEGSAPDNDHARRIEATRLVRGLPATGRVIGTVNATCIARLPRGFPGARAVGRPPMRSRAWVSGKIVAPPTANVQKPVTGSTKAATPAEANQTIDDTNWPTNPQHRRSVNPAEHGR